ncbi:MAG: thiolase family protein [Pseudomonadales bacterium]|nr:thiolase family protein [Pseudomonadales bacterium]NRA16538.1 thiolase family protein [Oceanospirillaceae bacterium]
MNNAVIAAYTRSPFHLANRGELANVRPDDLLTNTVRGLLQQTGIAGGDIEDLICGCAFPEGEQGFNIARLVVFMSGLPNSVGGSTINRWCGSSMQAAHMAAGSIALGAGDAFICAGIESMSRIPMMGFNPMPNPDLYAKFPKALMSMGDTAEVVAKKYHISRSAQEKFAMASQLKAANARNSGHFKDEIIAINGITEDGCIRAETNLAQLATLKPAFDLNGTVTAGTSSPLTDGAAALLVCSEQYASTNKIKPLARIVAVAISGCDPQIMGMGPVAATNKALQRAGLKIDDIDIVELNEAFAAQSLACINELGIDPNKVNLDGGALALGHPLGASGARILGKVASLLKREGKRYGLATQCIGGGQGIATIVEAI